MDMMDFTGLFRGEILACIASGPSLTREQVDYCRDKAASIVVNRTVELAPWADILYCCDDQVIRYLDGARDFAGLKICPQDRAASYPEWEHIEGRKGEGFSLTPGVIHYGSNSGFQALNLAVQCDPAQILLLGYDMKPSSTGHHWHPDDGPHKAPVPPYEQFLKWFDTVQPEYRDGRILNCTPGSALTIFPKAALEDVL